MKRAFAALAALLFAVLPLAGAVSALAEDAHAPILNISVVNNEPLYTDKLLYTAFGDMGLRLMVSPAVSLHEGFMLVVNGDRDGVVSAMPDAELTYPNLKKVNVPLDTNYYNVYRRADYDAFERRGEEGDQDWSFLAGQRIAALTGRPYIDSCLETLPEHPDTSVTFKENEESLFAGLLDGEYDMVIFSVRRYERFSPPEGAVLESEIVSQPVFLYLNEGKHGDKTRELAGALANLKDKDDGRADAIYNNQHVPGLSSKSTILHIYSQSKDMLREEAFSEGFNNRYTGGAGYDLYSISLDAKLHVNDALRQTYYINMLRRDCVSKNVAAIIVSGEDAMDFLSLFYARFFPETPVLYYGIGENYQINMGEFNSRFNGVREHVAAYDTVNYALTLFPETKKIFVINDYTTEGRKYQSEIESQLAALAADINMDGIDIEYSGYIPHDELFSRIAWLPRNSMILYGSYFVDSTGQYFTLGDSKRDLDSLYGGKDAKDKIPLFTLYSTRLGFGAVCGNSPDYVKFGEIIGDMLNQVLKGAVNLPAADPRTCNVWVFDHPLLVEFGLDKSVLPSNALIYDVIEDETGPNVNRTLVWAVIGLLLCAVAIAMLTRFVLNYRSKNEELLKMQKNLYTAEDIMQKDRSLHAVRDRLQKIINTAPVGFMLTVDGYIRDVNDYMRKNVGVKKGDLAVSIYHDPKQREMLVKALNDLIEIEDKIITINMVNGEKHRFLSNASSVEYEGKNALMFWGMDIEQNEAQKDKLLVAQENLKDILDTLPVAVRIMDMETFRVSFVNRVCLEMFGGKPGDDIAKFDMFKFVPKLQPDGTPSMDVMRPLMSADGMVSTDMVLCRHTGEQFDAHITTCKTDFFGRLSSIGIIKDIAAEKEYQRMLLSAAEKEKEANQLKSRFLVNMSHEIRTPMNAIIGLTEIELRRTLPGDVRDIYKKINTSSKNLLEIINDILDLSKIEADKMELFVEEFELEDVMNSALLVSSPRLEGKNVECLVNASPDLPKFLIGDKVRLWQVIKNPLDNATKYTDEGKIVMSVFCDQRRSNDETVYITFIIEDTGIGISEDQMKQLFTPYSQIYSDAQKRYKGTGLGMVISKQLVELMGGVMEIDSRLGEGTCVTVRIPFKRSLNAETGKDTAGELEGMNILTVDDDTLSLDIMQELLKNSGATCVSAASGEEALQRVIEFRDKGKSFDAVMLDYVMPGLNGLETARQIQASLSKAPNLLMVTAYQKQLFKQELEVSGISGVIEKPYIPSQFIRKLCAAVKGTSDEDSGAEEFVQYKDAKVLLCEDYRLNQEVASGMLAQFGITPVIAETGKDGIDILEGGKEKFDLVFMDLHMPVMDGFIATRVIRGNPKFKKLPIVSMTADAMKEVESECIAAGMNDHVAKPVSFKDLNRVLLKWMPEGKRAGKGKAHAAPRQSHAQSASHEALSRFGGNKELYERALRDFANDVPDKWPPFHVAVQNTEELKLRVHKYKGAAGNLAVSDLFRYAKQFERTIIDGKPDRELYEAFIGSCSAFKRGYASYASEEEHQPETAGTGKELAALFDKLRGALRDYDPGVTSEVIAKLESKRWPGTDAEKLSKLYEAARNYEFDEALSIVEEIKSLKKT